MLPIVLAALVGTAASAEVPGDVRCASRCVAAFGACKSQPGANNAQCAAELSNCVGYNPFASEPFVTPTACSTSTTTTVTSVPDDVRCASRCVAAFGACKSQPGANNAQCAAELSNCVGYNPFASEPFVTPTACSTSTTTTVTSVPDDVRCASRCVAAFGACKSQPGANNAQCAAELSNCVGYNPFANEPFVTPTACSTSTTTVTSVPDNVRCASRCVAAFGACKSQPGANNAQCAAELSNCVGYNPFTGSPFVTPTACSGTPSTTGPATITTSCTDSAGTTLPPTTTTGGINPPIVTAGGNNLEPAMLLAALGAAALL